MSRSSVGSGCVMPPRRGAMLPLMAVSLAGVMGAMALAIDAGSLHQQRRVAQTAADAGALAGASEMYRGRADLVTSSARAESARNRFTHGASGVTVTVNRGPATGYYAGNSNFVEVIVTRAVPMYFGSLIGRSSASISMRAVAGISTPSDNCLYSLHNNAEKAINVSGATSSLTADCGVVANSSNTKAVLIESNGTLRVDDLAVTGGIDQSGGNIIATGSIQTAVPRSPDPLAYLQMPYFDPQFCNYTNTKVDSYGVTTVLSPGNYCGGIEITSNGTAALLPGLYVLLGGGLKMGGGLITGTGVTFINTNAPTAMGGADKFQKFEMGSASRAVLSAMTTGTLAGILFYQDPLAGKPGDVYENVIASGSNSLLTGTLYFPTQPIELGASGSTTTINGGVVATMIKVSSGSTVTINGPGGVTDSPFKRVSLVE